MWLKVFSSDSEPNIYSFNNKNTSLTKFIFFGVNICYKKYKGHKRCGSAPLQAHRLVPSAYSRQTSLHGVSRTHQPQGLCTSCSLCLEWSLPAWPCSLHASLRSLLRCPSSEGSVTLSLKQSTPSTSLRLLLCSIFLHMFLTLSPRIILISLLSISPCKASPMRAGLWPVFSITVGPAPDQCLAQGQSLAGIREVNQVPLSSSLHPVSAPVGPQGTPQGCARAMGQLGSWVLITCSLRASAAFSEATTCWGRGTVCLGEPKRKYQMAMQFIIPPTV